MKSLRSILPLVVLSLVAVAAWQFGAPAASPVAIAAEKAPASAPAAAPATAPATASVAASAARAELAEMAKRDTVSPLLRTVAKAVTPAVVEVRVSRTIREADMPDMDEFFRRFFREQPGPRGPGNQPNPQPRQPQPRERTVHGLGSGVIIDAEKGYVITNYHVVGESNTVEVVLSDHRVLTNEWIRRDPVTDLAVIKLAKPEGLTAAPLGDSEKMETGDMVLAIGAPSGLSQTVTMGIISATGRSALGGDRNAYGDYIQTDAAINRGNSGGPLVNMKGEVIGINNMIISSSGGNQGIGLAVSSSMVKYVMEQLISKGKVTRGFLGVGIQDVDENLAKSFGMTDMRGALVTEVKPDSAAEKAGIKVGDFIVAVDGRPITNRNQLRNIIASLGPARTVNVEVIRDGERKKIEVKLGEQPKDLAGLPGIEGGEEPAVAKGVARFGLELATMNEELAAKYGYKKEQKGVVITDVKQGSNAAEQGLAEGMMVVKVASKDVDTAEAAGEALSDKSADKGVRLLVSEPQGGQRFVFITPEK